jgi:hypothetical protein
VRPQRIYRQGFRDVEADIVFHVPLREARPRRGRPRVWCYVLLEHQSEPDDMMPLRVVDYMTQIFKDQLRKRGRGRPLAQGPQLQPAGRCLRLPLETLVANRRGLP